MSIKITKKMLNSMGACGEAMQVFKENFPRGLTIKSLDADVLMDLKRIGLDAAWFVNSYHITSADIEELQAIRSRIADVYYRNDKADRVRNEDLLSALRDAHIGVTRATTELRTVLVFNDLERVQHPVKRAVSKTIKAVKKAVAKRRTLRAMKGAM